jgi:hypothetical protein
VNLSKPIFYLDTVNVVRNSIAVHFNGNRIDSGFTVDVNGPKIIFNQFFVGKQVEIYYRYISNIGTLVYRHKPMDLIEPEFGFEFRSFYNYKQENSTTSALFGDGLNVSGNIARGLGFGNNQDLVLNSNLNLQLNGNLGKGISLLAAISDENNPIQPQGNTQQIQDFDKVFISIMKDSNSLTVGDFLMNTNKDQYFMKYFKKSRGLQLDYLVHSKITQHIQANAAVSRGKFVRNEIQGQEGVQGPYRLQGANSELNIIVISGTEVVYIDGKKLERGQQNDYVIDYNTGEINFMPNRLINRYNRIVVEFQYSDRNYSRSVFTVSDAFKSKNFNASVNYYTEQDNKLQATDTSNRSQIQTLLEQSGDALATYQIERNYEQLQTDRVNYRKIDSLGYKIYLFTNNPAADSGFYTTTFSYVGKGKGDYIQIASSANGRVYAWVQPINGLPMGDYAPYVQLVAPKRLQMLTANASYQNGRNFELKIEGAYTNNNKNTFSVLDKQNDDGLGLFLSMNQKDFHFKEFKIGSSVKLEYINNNFAYVERYRAVEFNRIWNRQLNNANQSQGAFERIATASGNIIFKEKHKLTLEMSNYNKGRFFDGYRLLSDYSYSGKKLFFKAYNEQLSTKGINALLENKNRSQNTQIEARLNLENLNVGANVVLEESKFSSDTAVQIEANSFKYEQVSAFVESKQTKKWTYRLDANFRTDYLPLINDFVFASLGKNVNASIEHAGSKLNRFKFIGSYRKLHLAGLSKEDEVILSRVEYNASFFKKLITSSTYYQIGTGREQKRQFSFALVQSGNGTHTWIDYNKNGIEEINEFELAAYKDQATYVKVYLPTNEFIKSNSNEFNQTIRIQAPNAWQTSTSFKRFAAKFNTITSYRADRKITDNRLEMILNPFQLNVSDSSLIAVNSLIKQTTFFNRSNSKFGLEHTIQTNKGKQFLNSGFEWKQNNKQQIVSRFGFSKKINLVLEAELSSKQNRNAFFENRNYNYNSKLIRPELFYQTISGLRFGAYFKYTEAFNAPEFGNDQAYLGETGVEIRYFIINKGNVDFKMASHNINFIGNANSPLAFDILNGLSNGKNLTWNISFGGKTKSNIQLNISYEGRKTQTFKTVHIGRAEARYIF